MFLPNPPPPFGRGEDIGWRAIKLIGVEEYKMREFFKRWMSFRNLLKSSATAGRLGKGRLFSIFPVKINRR